MTKSRRPGLLTVVMFSCLTVGHPQAPATGRSAVADSAKPGTSAGNIEVLSDTKGVDFGPYLSKFLQQVRKTWYNLIPEEARPPQLVAGKVSIEFGILPDGRIAGMKIVHPSGDVQLDRAAWGGITACSPSDPLPPEYKRPFLALRFHFYYNPQRLPPDQQPTPAPAKLPGEKPEPHQIAPP